MKGSVISSLLLLTVASVARAGIPDGYEYGYVNFGQADPQTLQPKINLASGDQFGRVVAMWEHIVAVASNEMAVDSSSGEAGYQGKVFLFHRNYMLVWEDSEQYFTSGNHNDGFGTAVALYDGILAIGAPQDSSMGDSRGKVFIYTGNSFGTGTSVVATEHAEDNDYFGHAVALTHGFTDYYGTGTLVVGAWGHNKDHEHEEVGCVFIFAQLEQGYWTEVGVIEPSVMVNHGGFGYSLSSYGNALVVGSYGSDHAHVFELHGHTHECPHEGPDHPEEDMPAECQDDDGNDDGNDNGRRVLQGGGPPDENKRYYLEWKYDEALMIGFENGKGGGKPEEKDNIQHFGSSVSIYNASGVLTVAVGCSECVTDNDVEVGAVYVFSKLAQSHAAVGWYPDDFEHPKRNLRMLQDEKEEEKKFLWNPYEHDSHASRDGEYWFTENSFWGRIQYEHFGWSICIDQSNLLVGSNPSSYTQGRAEVYSRKKITSGAPDYVQGGPLFDTSWRWSSNLQDKSGITGDKYGYSVAMHGNSAIVGSILSGLQEDGSFGSGAAYVYDKVYLRKIVDNSGNNNDDGNSNPSNPSIMEELSDTHSFLGITFISSSSVIGFCLTLVLFYGVYRGFGGEKSPGALVMDSFGCGSGDDDGRGVRRASRPLHLSHAMDDSTSSVSTSGSTRGLRPQGNSSAYSGLNTSSSHGPSGTSPASKFKPRQQYVPKGPPRPTYAASKNKGGGINDL
mmetsp:Transcript_18515/g.30864  ORF Transcript_18515/g.30864 Transcript_18515/m.30864 type:complete len:731 (-) Transcript_18515:281-2473(-)